MRAINRLSRHWIFRPVLATRKSLALSSALALVATLLPLEGIPAATDISNSSQGVRLTQNKQAPLSLTVNGIQKADTIIVLLRTTDVLVRESDLLNATVPMPQAVINDVNGTRYVSLDSLIPHVTYRIDLVALSLDLQIEPSLLGHSIVNVSGISPNNQLAKTDPSGFLTYSVSSDTSNLAGQLNGFI